MECRIFVKYKSSGFTFLLSVVSRSEMQLQMLVNVIQT